MSPFKIASFSLVMTYLLFLLTSQEITFDAMVSAVPSTKLYDKPACYKRQTVSKCDLQLQYYDVKRRFHVYLRILQNCLIQLYCCISIDLLQDLAGRTLL